MRRSGRECRDGFAWEERFGILRFGFVVFVLGVFFLPLSFPQFPCSVVFCSAGKRLIPSALTKFCMVFGFVCCLS